MSKFTPGEWVVKHWEVRDNQGALEGCGFQVMTVHDGDEQAIHTISLEGDPESTEADLHLISAAKNLLEACTTARDMLANAREAFVECHQLRDVRIEDPVAHGLWFVEDGVWIDPEDAEPLREYDRALAQIDAAISKATAEKAQEN